MVVDSALTDDELLGGLAGNAAPAGPAPRPPRAEPGRALALTVVPSTGK
jgi:hypothetical protein